MSWQAGGLSFQRYWGALDEKGQRTRWATVSDGTQDVAGIHVHPRRAGSTRRVYVDAHGGTATGRTLREALATAITRAQMTIDTLDALRCRTVTDPPPSPWALARQAKDLGMSREEIGEILVGALDHAEAGQGWDVLGTWLEESVAEARSDAEDMRREESDHDRYTAAEAAAWARGGR